MIRFVESQSNAAHTWIDMEETVDGVIYTRTVGMIIPVLEGYQATTSFSEEETFKAFQQAKDFIIESQKRNKMSIRKV